jgi:hypothetical protein
MSAAFPGLVTATIGKLTTAAQAGEKGLTSSESTMVRRARMTPRPLEPRWELEGAAVVNGRSKVI